MITVEELNVIQSQWMDLDAFASESRKQEVFALMRTTPKSYITYNGTVANLMINASGYCANGMTLIEAKELAPQYKIRTDIAWNCAGQFIKL
jgi:hypothetical protein